MVRLLKHKTLMEITIKTITHCLTTNTPFRDGPLENLKGGGGGGEVKKKKNRAREN